MARPIVISNGNMHVGINHFGMVHDFYYPYVGLENHSAGKSLRHKVGVWVDGKISWIDDGTWEIRIKSSKEMLAGHIRTHSKDLGIILEFDDTIDSSVDGFMRSVHIINTADYEREIRLFMHQAFVIGDSRSNTDTAQYLPDTQAILHYRGQRMFIVGAKADDVSHFDQFTVGLFGIEGREGSYRDADDGELQGCTVEHGRVDSVLRFKLSIAAHASRRVFYWIAAGKSLREALNTHKLIDLHGHGARQYATAVWWQEWLKPTIDSAAKLPKRQQDLFTKSALVIKSHIDNRGAVIASTDTAMLNYWRDVYGYCWPRDAAYVLWPLIRMGYTDEAMQYFRFCRTQLHPRGYLHHKYRADGALGSSWHSYVHDSGNAAPIQEDETAITLFSFAQYYYAHPSEELLDEFYNSLIKPMANYMAQHIDESTNLPKPSYDLWEEIYITSTYTTAVVYAALIAAAQLAEIRHDDTSAVKWRAVADDMQVAAKKYLYNTDRGMLRKGIIVYDGGNEINYNDTLDMSSFYGCFMYGLFPANSEEISNTVNAITTTFLPDSENFTGLPRYENDTYLRRDGKAPNPWLITSMWLAQYYTEIGESEKSATIMQWVEDRASSTGHFSEQINQDTGEHMSVSPLVWSHAEYMATLLDAMTENS